MPLFVLPISSALSATTTTSSAHCIIYRVPRYRRTPTSSQFQSNLGRRQFHDYFVTHLPSSSLHPDGRSSVPSPNHHKLPRSESKPYEGKATHSPTTFPPASPTIGVSRETTVVRIPLKSAKHHFGAGVARGSRPYNEDTYQAGTIELPAFSKRQPISLTRRNGALQQENQSGQSASGDPQVFYYGVFDGHGGAECSEFLRDRLHGYLEDAAERFHLQSTLKKPQEQALKNSEQSETDDKSRTDVVDLQRRLVNAWRDTVGGYFRRFRPEYFTALQTSPSDPTEPVKPPNSIEAALTYAFLHADLDFTSAQAAKHTPRNSTSAQDNDPVMADRPLNDSDVLSHPSKPASQNLTTLLNAPIGGNTRFQGGSTASIALISTPTPIPYWHPASPGTIITAHCGDTRILLCRVDNGQPVTMTSNHHPSAPIEATRLRRYSTSFVTDSFGEERVLGLANTRSFGDISSKRIGVSAEPEIRILDMRASEYSFMVLMTDGVSGPLDDQEVVDVVKEAKTPEQASRDLVSLATAIGQRQADNATALVVRLGGWERRSEGGVGSLGTREQRQFKKASADDPRASRQ